MNLFLLPHRFQKPALLLCLLFGVLVVLIETYNLELSFLAFKAPEKTFLSNDNLTDEVALGGFLLSLLAYGFSREADEDEFSVSMRFRALLLAVLTHTLLSLALVFFIYGWAFPVLAAFQLFTVMILYLFFYKGQRLLNRLRTLRS